MKTKIYCKNCKHIDTPIMLCRSQKAISSLPRKKLTPDEKAYGKRLSKKIYSVDNLRFNKNNNCEFFEKEILVKTSWKFWKW